MENTFRLFTLVVTLSMLAACDDFSGSSENSKPLDAATVHANALVLDAHADIEIPVKKIVMLAPTVSRKLNLQKCVRVVLTRSLWRWP